MSTSNFNLRGIPSEVLLSLKKEAKRSHTSVNTLLLKMIEKRLGLTREKHAYHDLDYLAGTWSEADANEFKANTEFFEKIV